MAMFTHYTPLGHALDMCILWLQQEAKKIKLGAEDIWKEVWLQLQWKANKQT